MKLQTRKQIANSIAKRGGYGKATDILLSPGGQSKIIKTTSYGYRKCTNNQYVPKAYLRNFGWKNTYYQNAITVVALSTEDWNRGLQNELILKVKGVIK